MTYTPRALRAIGWLTIVSALAGTASAAALLGSAYGLMILGFGVGFILAGLAFLRTPLVPGTVARWTYLLIGLWTLFPMLPSLFLPLVWGRITVGTWFFMFAGIGVILLRAGRSGAATAAHPDVVPADPVRTP